MFKVFGKANLDLHELKDVKLDVETTLNNRLLCYVEEDIELPDDAGTSLTTLMSSRREKKRINLPNVATLNVRGCASQMKRQKIFEIMERRNLVCLGITETKMVPKEAWIEENKKNQMIMMPSTSVHHGVGFCIRKVEDTKWKCISNRVASVKMNLPNLNVNCIVGYAPTSPVCDKYPEEREKFYKEIEDAWCPQSTNIILRDFNSKVGKRCDDTYPNNAGRFSTGTQNTGGADLLSFAQRK
eukprot:gene10286-18983_t